MSKETAAAEVATDDTAITALVPTSPTALKTADGYGAFSDAEAAAIANNIDSLLKAMSVTEFKGAKGFLNVPLNLLDAFPFQMQEDSQQYPGQKVTVDKVMLEVADLATGEVHFVMQNANPSRERYISLYAEVQRLNATTGNNKRLTLTNVEFMEVGNLNKGNRPIVLQFTPDTQRIWSNVVGT